MAKYGSVKHKDATGVHPASIKALEFSDIPVGNQGQPAAPGDEGEVAINIQERMDVFGSHKNFSDTGGVTGYED